MEVESLPEQIGILLRRLRLEAGLSQEAFADLCELHRTYVGSIERGEKSISVETASKVSNALGLSLSQFFKRLEQEFPSLNKRKQPK